VINLKPNPGKRNIVSNAKILIKHGYEPEEAHDIAYKYAHQRSRQRFNHIHNATQREQHKR